MDRGSSSGIGVVDVKVNHVETPEEIARRIERADQALGSGTGRLGASRLRLLDAEAERRGPQDRGAGEGARSVPGAQPVGLGVIAGGGMDLWSLTDLCTPWCVHVVATLRVADHLEAGKSDISDLASAAGADRDSLYRVMRHLVSKGLFDEPVRGRFALNETARGLLNEGVRISLDLDGFGSRMAYAWGTLLAAVRSGRPAYHEHFGRDFWSDLEAHPDIAGNFDALWGGPDMGVPIQRSWSMPRSGSRSPPSWMWAAGPARSSPKFAARPGVQESSSTFREPSPALARCSNRPEWQTGSRPSGRAFSIPCRGAPMSTSSKMS